MMLAHLLVDIQGDENADGLRACFGEFEGSVRQSRMALRVVPDKRWTSFETVVPADVLIRVVTYLALLDDVSYSVRFGPEGY